jgi:hypothetical protein
MSLTAIRAAASRSPRAGSAGSVTADLPQNDVDGLRAILADRASTTSSSPKHARTRRRPATHGYLIRREDHESPESAPYLGRRVQRQTLNRHQAFRQSDGPEARPEHGGTPAPRSRLGRPPLAVAFMAPSVPAAHHTNAYTVNRGVTTVKALRSSIGTDLVRRLPHGSHAVRIVRFRAIDAVGYDSVRISKSPGRTGCGRDFRVVRRQGLEPRTR